MFQVNVLSCQSFYLYSKQLLSYPVDHRESPSSVLEPENHVHPRHTLRYVNDPQACMNLGQRYADTNLLVSMYSSMRQK
jgi:hypothetical protein